MWLKGTLSCFGFVINTLNAGNQQCNNLFHLSAAGGPVPGGFGSYRYQMDCSMQRERERAEFSAVLRRAQRVWVLVINP